MQYLYGKTLEELQQLCVEHSLPRFAAKQIADWLYKKRVDSIDQMTNLSLATRELLNQNYSVGVFPPIQDFISKDGTRKYLFPTSTAYPIEAVYIPSDDRGTLCVSSQIGCKMNCLFCMTGKQGFQGNLTSREILNQIRSIEEYDELTNFVFMGMGEPLDNYSELHKALRVLTESWGYAMSPRRITVSTIGVIPMLKRLIEETEVHVAISLHVPFPDERKSLMPIERAHSTESLLALLHEYDFRGQRRLSFEYILFGGVNDTDQHADELIRLLRPFYCRVNLIRYHPIPGVSLPATDQIALDRFQQRLSAKGILCTVRASRGEDIMAACGMLSSHHKETE